MNISERIRREADWLEEGTKHDVSDLYSLADRIDAEMVELPKGRDGKIIDVGDIVYVSGDFTDAPATCTVVSMRYYMKDVWGVSLSNGSMRRPDALVHNEPDSLDKIAGELEGVADCGDILEGEEMKLRELIGRLRRLGKEENDG